jgi:hypothetical protein
MAKETNKGKGKSGKGEEPEMVVSIAAHPRAKAAIRRARTRAALIVFALVLALNIIGDQTAFDATWRALLAGIVANVIVWRFAIVIWRHIVIAEVREIEEEREERLKAEQEERAKKLADEQARAV